MSDPIPDRFTTALAAVEAVCAGFDSREDFRPFEPGRWIRDVSHRWGDGVAHVAFILDVNAEILGFYVILRHSRDARPPTELVEAAARANYGLLAGSFEISLDSGEIRYRSALPLIGEDVEPGQVAKMMSDALQMAKHYRSAFERVGQGEDPGVAIDAVEAEPR